jgi:hypothetical protein
MIDNTMAAARLRRKPWLCLMCLAAAAVLGGVPLPMGATATEYVVVDRNTGLAISGMDPVAYFIDGAPMPGSGAFEYSWERAIWRFRNEGNRGAFAAHPEVYAPRFGGYDPVGIARGIAVAGDPRLWCVSGQRLYLFYTPETRRAFLQDPEGITETADSNWPTVQLTLSP